MVDSSRHAIYLSVPRKATIACASDSERPRSSIAVSVLKAAGLTIQRLVSSGGLPSTPAINGHCEGLPKPSNAGPDVPTASGTDETT